ncbi:M16 family metallopeptidase [Thalassotalea profundi]|uniref:Peptidase M16 n=1 Tax=Thalassotalea profundi TaxID=2036687 RepID=A0ABQ3IU52_9GAMM|nr:pitrilysin family protein [Thalassotalea profundi]GHE89893.1 peptidase M16 [Thalassotalea profundi]
MKASKLIAYTALCTSALLISCTDTSIKNTTQTEKTQSDKQATPHSSADLNIEYEKFTLENGLQVIFHIDRSDPVVAVALTAHVGSARELPGRTGFAHLFEHLLFLESENLGKGGLDKMSARIGGSGANGSTSRDRTNYFQTVPKNALEKMIWAEADKLGYFINTVTEPVLAKEKQVVKNEKRQSNDNRPYGHTQYVIDKNLYPEGHPYSWQVIGSLEDLQNATLQDVKDFFNRWYVPNNVTLVVSGDFDKNQATQWIHKYFDEIPKGESIKRNKQQAANLKESKRLYFEDNYAKSAQLTVTWPTVPLYHPDSYPLEVLRELLSDGKSAVMNKILVDQLKLTSSVRMGAYDSELAGQTSIRVTAFEGIDLNSVYTAINQAFALFEQEKFSEDDLERIKAEQETQFYQGLSSALGKGFQLAQYNIYTGEPGFINQDVNNILSVSSDDVWRVYNKYIKNQPFVATSFVPKDNAQLALTNSIQADVVEEKIVIGAEDKFDASQQASYEKTPSSFDRSIEPPYDDSPLVINPPKVWQNKLTNGLTLYGIENSEVPLVSFNIEIAGGMLFDKPNKIGVARLTAELMNRGTKNKSRAELENAIKKLGAQINVSGSKDSISINGTTLAKNYSQTITLVKEILLEPRWDQVEFDLAKEATINAIKQMAANPNSIAALEFQKLLYGQDHLLANSHFGTEKSINEINIADLKTYYQNALSPNLTKFHVVGDITQQAVNDSIKSLASNWPNKSLELPQLTTPSMPQKAQVYFYDVPNAKQSMITIGNPALKATDTDFYPAQVMNYRLGGGSFASQLTQELRESKGYTYGIRSSFSGSKLDGSFMINSGVRANITLEAVALVRDIMKNYELGFNEQDLAVTKGYFLKSNARRFETLGAKLEVLKNMSEYGLPADYVQQRATAIETLTLADIKALANKYIQPDKMIYLVVGDAKTQLNRLKDLGLGVPVLLNPKK